MYAIRSYYVASNTELEAIIKLPNHALATSGNYRNFYVADGKKIDNPYLGFLSAGEHQLEAT